MLYTLKRFKIPFFKNQLLNLVTLCYGFCISYRLAHVLSNFSTFNGFKYPIPKTINTASSHLLVLLQPLFHSGHIFVSVSFQILNFFFLRFLRRIHTNRLIHLLL